MRLNNYSIGLDKNTRSSRLGCSVCKKKVNNDTSIEHLSSKPWIDKRNLKNVSNEKLKNCEYNKLTPSIILRPSGNECYCNHMEQTRNVSFPRLICSKQFKTPHQTDVDKKWLHEIIEFRRQNWFDCHTESFINGNCVQNINPLSKYIIIFL